jgi:DNA-binding transcriptional ArsR family regulator
MPGVADIFRALADPTRRAILDELVEKSPQTLFELCSRLAMNRGVSPTRQAISQHLGVLEASGLITVRRAGRFKLHEINSAPLATLTSRWLTTERKFAMRIKLSSVFVDDQERAVAFYTEKLGFIKKTDVPLGEHRWLTVVSEEDPDGVELLLEPDDHPAVRPFKDALVSDGIPAASFAVPDVGAEYARLAGIGVTFTQQPTQMGPATTAVLDDTCGNLIQIASRS